MAHWGPHASTPAEPVLSDWGARLQERTQPLQPDDASYGWAHAILCETLAQPFLQVAELIDPPEPYPPWGPLFDLDACPTWALPWLAQAVGSKLPVGLTDAQARDFIRDASGHKVGTVAAMRSALVATLVSSNPPSPPVVWFREREGSAYHLEIVTLTGETPNPTQSLNALLAAKPGGLTLAFTQVVSWDYQAMTDAGGTYAALGTTYTTYAKLAARTPG
jgi:hypothetical protein